MTLETKRLRSSPAIGGPLPALAGLRPVDRDLAEEAEEAGLAGPHIASARGQFEGACVELPCPGQPRDRRSLGGQHPRGQRGVGCVECHHGGSRRKPTPFEHYNATIATVVTPRDCSRCHLAEAEEFDPEPPRQGRATSSPRSTTSSLRRWKGARMESFNPALADTRASSVDMVNGSRQRLQSGCQQCHGSKVALQSTDGGMITVDRPRARRRTAVPTNLDAVLPSHREATSNGRPMLPSPVPGPTPASAGSTSTAPAGSCYGLPQPPRLLAAPGPTAGELRQVPPRPRSPPKGDLRGVEARRRLSGT